MDIFGKTKFIIFYGIIISFIAGITFILRCIKTVSPGP